MTVLEMPVNEKLRIEALKRYDILDTPPDGSFDKITRLASTLFNVPIAIISLVDTDRIWFKSHHGLTVNQIGREPGLCASAILSNETYVVGDAGSDPRTLSNPLVVGELGLRFYAAVPLQTKDAYNLGTLCIIDQKPRELSDNEKDMLEQLAGIVMEEMEMRLALRNTVNNVKKLSSDISYHLNKTVKNMEKASPDDQKEAISNYLDASRMFLMNVENQLDQL